MVRIDSIKKLYDNLLKFDDLSNKILLEDRIITINFHSNFIIKIELNSYFYVYFNETFFYDIDEQDILETLSDIITKNHIFIERKKILRGKKILVISEEEFNNNKKKWYNNRTTSVYSTEKLIFDNRNS